MTITDIVSLIIILIVLSTIIFFSYVFPHIKYKGHAKCSSCYMVKKAKRLTKDYKKEKNKNKD